MVGARFWGNGPEEIGQAAPDTFQVLHQHGSETTKTITNIARIVLFWSVKLTYRAALGQLKRQRQQRQSLWLKKDRIQFVRQRQGNLVQKNKGKLWIFPHCSSTVSTLTRNYPRFLREHQHINHIVTFHKRKLFTNHVSQLLSSFVPLSSWYVKSAAGKIFEFIQVQWISCKRPSLRSVTGCQNEDKSFVIQHSLWCHFNQHHPNHQLCISADTLISFLPPYNLYYKPQEWFQWDGCPVLSTIFSQSGVYPTDLKGNIVERPRSGRHFC